MREGHSVFIEVKKMVTLRAYILADINVFFTTLRCSMYDIEISRKLEGIHPKSVNNFE